MPALAALGEPGPGYPLPWSVQTWLPGRTGDEDDPSGEVTFASDLAEFIAAVSAIGTRGRTFTSRGLSAWNLLQAGRARCSVPR